MSKKLGFVMIILFIIVQIVGCGSKDPAEDQGKDYEVSTEPVTLKLLAQVGITDLEFAKFFTEPIKKKYPYITLELVRPDSKINAESLITSGELPDILLTSTTGVRYLQKLDAVEDLNPYIKKFKEDLNRFEPVTIESLKHYSDKGEMVALPYAMNFSALFYNKDIFDKFGVPYPKDGMTWDDAIAIAVKLTRNEGGVQYRGLNPGGADLMGYGLSLPYVDFKTNQPLLDTDKWKMVVSKAVEIYGMPGWMDGTTPGGQGQGNFQKDRNMAMLGAWGDTMIGSLEQLHKQGQPINWDMVTLPNFKEASGFAREIDFHMLLMSKPSKHKDQTYQVLSLIASSEVQEIINKTGRLTVLQKNAEFQKNFGAELETLKGKNMNAIFGSKPNLLHLQTEFDGKARGLISNAAYDVARGKLDVNTAIRNAQEELAQHIAREKQGSK